MKSARLRDRRAATIGVLSLAVAGAVVLTVALASAAEFTEMHTDTIPATDTDWVTPVGPPDPLVFPQFDPAKGTLTKVTVQFDSALTGSIAVENTSTTSGCDVELNWGADVTLDTQDGVLTSALGQTEMESLTDFDGELDFAGTSGLTFADLLQVDSQIVDITDALVFAPYIGTGDIALEAAATATSSESGCGNVVTQFVTQAAIDAKVTYTFEANPDIDIEKATNGDDADNPPGPAILVGDRVDWTYVVTNPGDVSLSNVVVIDDAGTPGFMGDDFSPGFLSGDDNTNGLLDPGETWNYSAATTAALGQYGNIADVVGTPPVGDPPTDSDPSHYFGIDPGAKIEIAESATNAIGDEHTFVVNVMEDPEGDGTFVAAQDELVDVVFTEANGADANAAAQCTTLADGTCVVMINSAAAGMITAHASSTVDVNGTDVFVETDGVAPNSGDAIKTYVDAKITIAPDATNRVGDPHTFTTTVWVDDGSGTDADGEMGSFDRAPDADVVVTLANGGAAVADPAGPFNGTTDAMGEFAVTFTSLTPGTVTGHAMTEVQVDGVLLLRETDGVSPNSGDAVKTFIEPVIDIEKATNGEDADTPTGPQIPVGDAVTWTYVVTNPDDVPLENVIVTDDNGTPGDTGDDFSPVFQGGDTNTNNLLDPGEEWLYEAADTATAGQYANVASVVGTPPVGPDVTDEDPSHYFGVEADIVIEKETNGLPGDDANCADGPIVLPGDPITWTYLVSNPGNVPLAQVVVIDDNGTPGDTSDDFSPAFVGGDGNTDNLLDPGEIWVYEEVGVAGADSYRNVGSASGVPPVGDTVNAEDPSCYIAVVPEIDIEKATNGEDADTPTGPTIPVGDTVTWTYVVTNPDDVPLENVIVTDDNGTPGDMGDDFNPVFLGGDVNTNDLLDPGETWTYEASALAVAGQYANMATVVGTPPLGPDVTDADPSHYFGEEPPQGGEGCTPGYWKQPHHFWAWTGYDQDDAFEDVFGVDYDKTLLEALATGGGKEKALGRHAVAALLNAASSDVDYAFTEDDVIQIVQDAYDSGDFNTAKDLLETENERGCPIGRDPNG